MESKALALKIVEILDSKKAQDIDVLETEKVTTMTDYFIIATGTSTTQIKALADEVDFKLSELSIKPKHIEGYDGGTWVLVDYIDVVVHIFHKESRAFYSLERLWTDAPRLDISSIVKDNM